MDASDDQKRNRPGGNRGEECSNNDVGKSYRWPRRKSKKFATLALLLGGRRLSHLEVLDGACTYRAAAVVLALKEAGFPIVADRETVRDAAGRTTNIARYRIPADRLGDIRADAHRKGLAL